MERLAGVGCRIRKCSGTSFHLLSTLVQAEMKDFNEDFNERSSFRCPKCAIFFVSTVMFDRHVKIIFNEGIEHFSDLISDCEISSFVTCYRASTVLDVCI